uniref:Cytochrome c biogenesis FN n=1 Tax=Pelargonium citronellum TaxID=73188 RepID=A0A1J0PJU4_9ROSI|nr:cytochrome c biogenesis FN [Pelargonium citronellum]
MSLYEFFHFSLFLGLFLAFTYSKKESPGFSVTFSFWSCLLSFMGLLFCHISNNLGDYNVLSANAPFFYQISGTWSNHEGSLFSWCWISTFYVFLLFYRAKPKEHNASKQVGLKESLSYSFALNFIKKDTWKTKPLLHMVRDEKERTSFLEEKKSLGALGIALFFSTFLLVSSNPFVRNFFVCTEPLAELNPVLQDPILAIHPPCLFAGDVASAIIFALCISKMIKGILALYYPQIPIQSNSHLSWTTGVNTKIDDRDQEVLRIWILTCWCFLTVGILLGSWWAYHELGWGGWWFWDPVENASFIPWILVTALIHSVSRPMLQSWTYFLSILTFLCCVLGTFSIRSGLLASVHSFATDDTRGLLLWRFLLIMTLISFFLFYQMKKQSSFYRTYKKGMVSAHNIPVSLKAIGLN